MARMVSVMTTTKDYPIQILPSPTSLLVIVCACPCRAYSTSVVCAVCYLDICCVLIICWKLADSLSLSLSLSPCSLLFHHSNPSSPSSSLSLQPLFFLPPLIATDDHIPRRAPSPQPLHAWEAGGLEPKRFSSGSPPSPRATKKKPRPRSIAYLLEPNQTFEPPKKDGAQVQRRSKSNRIV